MRMEGKIKEINIPDEHFKKVRDLAEVQYKTKNEVFCPYLKCAVHFNAKGIEHIKFKSRNKARSRFDQYVRFKLVKLVPEIINKSHTVQGIWETSMWENQKSHGRWEKRLRMVTYYEFIAVIGKVRLKVIIKKIDNFEPYFWSIIPFWKTNEITNNRKLFDGNPEDD